MLAEFFPSLRLKRSRKKGQQRFFSSCLGRELTGCLPWLFTKCDTSRPFRILQQLDLTSSELPVKKLQSTERDLVREREEGKVGKSE